jgi:hypothetical protein
VSIFDWKNEASPIAKSFRGTVDKQSITPAEAKRRGLTREQRITFMRTNSITVGDNTPKFGLTKAKI